MTHLSLNRRWRPRAFSEVTRQEHVTRTLSNAVTQGRIAQAYLFGGRRGTGKTTMARLLAMCLNCQAHPAPTAEPCGECEACAATVAGANPDVIELDAASNRGIDEIRALQENVHLAPMSGRFKVYIIDEAHQMTKDAYNAFLKTLEEPPPHVVFVLATTEPEKIIPTVRSRCQRFEFRPVPEPDIARRLKTVAAAEGIEAPPELLSLIARKADGSLRDALGLLEQCVAFAGERPTVEDFLAVTGGVDLDSLRRLAGFVREGKAAEAIALVDELIRSGREAGAVCSGLVGYLRDVFLTGLRLAEKGQAAARDGEAGGAGPEPDPELAADVAGWETERLVGIMDTLARAEGEMKYSPQPRLALEVALLGLCLRAAGTPRELAGGARPATPSAARPATPSAARPATPSAPCPATPSAARPATPSAAPAGPPDDGRTGPAGPAAASSTGPPTTVPATLPPGPVEPPSGTSGDRGNTVKGSGDINLGWVRDNWDGLLDRIRRKSVFARAFLLKARPAALTGDVLTLSFDTQFHKEQMEEEKNRRVFEEALFETTGVKFRVQCRLETGGPAQPARGEEPAVPGARAGAAAGRDPAQAPRPAGPAARPGGGDRATVGREPSSEGSEAIRSALSIFGGRVLDDRDGAGQS